MSKNLEGKTVVILGATGGLGSGFAKIFSEKGTRLFLVGRNEETLNDLKANLNGDITIATSNLTDLSTLEQLSNKITEWSSEVDLIINAAGYDVRKSLEDHSADEIQKLIEINLLGTILITKALLKNLKDEKGNTIIHIGGFSDGRMAFPYYSVDVATRSGVFSFIESVNRELEIEGKDIRVTYFCPSPADTAAERPFHNLWRKMGIKIVPVEEVAQELIRTYEKKTNVGIMGGITTRVFAKLNSIMPRLADFIVMKKYGKMLKEYLYSSHESNKLIESIKLNKLSHRENDDELKVKTPSQVMNKIALVLVILSFLLYGLAILVPFTSLSLAYKTTLVPAFIIVGEIVWWIGIAIVGKQVVTKYRKYLNPCSWFGCNSNKSF
ncbi:short-subunit dehydrogenase [Paenibacillus turicensis]|uniref:Short-subunit dehydrogenase n=1 Tax=Paenibacillus turicensis TaxID=160487 RepID=A0ABS4FPL2_9BACL|nr:SDR family NAD(P)-dependent oxidoreductase [Paenibacillus turicensis]MBP1904524.1 short-subunit dehydrogenase [Paenibacillus turicensis]